jgi:hypothetical protein
VTEVTQVGGKGRGGRCTYLVSDLRRRGAGGGPVGQGVGVGRLRHAGTAVAAPCMELGKRTEETRVDSVDWIE